MPAAPTTMARSMPRSVSGVESNWYLAASVMSCRPCMPWRGPCVACVHTYGTMAMTLSRSVTPYPADALCGQRSDVAVVPLDAAFPILGPGIVSVQKPSAKGSARHQQAVVDGLCLKRRRGQRNEKERENN